jgi:hypothetical protein
VAAIAHVSVVAPVHRSQRRPNDRVWAVRRHAASIGTTCRTP